MAVHFGAVTHLLSTSGPTVGHFCRYKNCVKFHETLTDGREISFLNMRTHWFIFGKRTKHLCPSTLYLYELYVLNIQRN